MKTIIGLSIGILWAASGLFYTHKNKFYKNLALGGFIVGVALSLVLIGFALSEALDSNKSALPMGADMATSQVGSGNLNAPNNEGNVNTGPIGGNLNQSIVIGPKPRSLSNEQINELTSTLGTFPKSRVYFSIDSNADDGLAYAQFIGRALAKGGFAVWPQCDSSTPMGRVDEIVITPCPRDAPGLKPDVDLMLGAFAAAHIAAHEGTFAAMTTGPSVEITKPAILVFICRNSSQTP